MTIVSMTEKELTRLRVIQDLVSKRIACRTAASLLNLKPRQVRALKQNFLQLGPAGLVSGKRGRRSNRAYNANLKQQVLEIVRTYYSDFGPTLACQKLNEVHGLRISRDTMRLWMREDGLWQTRREQRKKVYQPRYRRECIGELVQIDGSEHYWFEDRGPQCTLLVYIDDATSRLMQLRFVQSESTFAYFAATAEYIKKHGKPVAFYSDKHSIFRVTNKNAVGGSGMTQFGRVLNELNIDIICANTPQAKGRVERANRTLQDRLVKELRLAGACTIEDGNQMLEAFMDDYNARFAKPPLNEKDLHRPLLPTEELGDIFVWKEERVVSASLTVQYDKVLFMLKQTDVSRDLPRKKIVISDYPDGRIVIAYNGLPLEYSIFDKVRHVNQAAIVDNKRLSAALQLIQAQQALRPMYRSESAPRRSAQPASVIQESLPLTQKRRARRKSNTSAKRIGAPPIALVKPSIGSGGLSYEDQLCLEIGRRMRAEEAADASSVKQARRQSRAKYLNAQSVESKRTLPQHAQHERVRLKSAA